VQAATVSQFSFAFVPSLSWQTIDFMVEHLQEKRKKARGKKLAVVPIRTLVVVSCAFNTSP
jgi:hypothetical protein